jgi:hypothetical protein
VNYRHGEGFRTPAGEDLSVRTEGRRPKAPRKEPAGGKVAPPVGFELQRVMGKIFAKPQIFMGRAEP